MRLHSSCPSWLVIWRLDLGWGICQLPCLWQETLLPQFLPPPHCVGLSTRQHCSNLLWMSDPSENKAGANDLDYEWHTITSVLCYWWHGPTLIQCGRNPHKDVNTRLQHYWGSSRSLATIILLWGTADSYTSFYGQHLAQVWLGRRYSVRSVDDKEIQGTPYKLELKEKYSWVKHNQKYFLINITNTSECFFLIFKCVYLY